MGVTSAGIVKRKPRSLRPLELSAVDTGNGLLEPHIVGGSEKGHCYYCAAPLFRSASARTRLLVACPTAQTAYKCLLLSIRPSEILAWPQGVVADKGARILHRGIPPTDGQSEVSPELAKLLGLLAQEARTDPKACCFFPPGRHVYTYI